MEDLPAKLPLKFKKLQHAWSTSIQLEGKEPVIAYYLRMHIIKEAMIINKQPYNGDDTDQFPFMSLMSYLENLKASMPEQDECFKTFETAACKFLLAAETDDKNLNYSNKVVRLYFIAGILFESMPIFSNYNKEHELKGKQAKYRATIISQALKQGIQPEPLILEADDEEAELLKELDNLSTNQNEIIQPSKPQSQQSCNSNQSFQQNFNQNPSNQQNMNQNFGQNSFQQTQKFDNFPQNPYNQTIPKPQAKPRTNSNIAVEKKFIAPQISTNNCAATLSDDQMSEAQKLLRNAASCLDYEDVNGALNFANRAVQFMSSGVMPE